jgi:hypothetical protein
VSSCAAPLGLVSLTTAYPGLTAWATRAEAARFRPLRGLHLGRIDMPVSGSVNLVVLLAHVPGALSHLSPLTQPYGFALARLGLGYLISRLRRCSFVPYG